LIFEYADRNGNVHEFTLHSAKTELTGQRMTPHGPKTSTIELTVGERGEEFYRLSCDLPCIAMEELTDYLLFVGGTNELIRVRSASFTTEVGSEDADSFHSACRIKSPLSAQSRFTVVGANRTAYCIRDTAKETIPPTPVCAPTIDAAPTADRHHGIDGTAPPLVDPWHAVTANEAGTVHGFYQTVAS
jgi:hypothetical protein